MYRIYVILNVLHLNKLYQSFLLILVFDILRYSNLESVPLGRINLVSWEQLETLILV